VHLNGLQQHLMMIKSNVGELVSLYVQKQEVARGIIVEQPLSFTIQNPLATKKPISLNVSTTKT
jgi:hypothetical protein